MNEDLTQPEEVREALADAFAEAYETSGGEWNIWTLADAVLPVLAGLEQRWRADERGKALRGVFALADDLDRVALAGGGITAVVYRQNADRIRAAAGPAPQTEKSWIVAKGCL